MSRLTDKKVLANFKAIKNINPNYVASKEELIYDKLGKLEDLEEQLGCPLDVLFKALKQDCVYTSRGIRRQLSIGSFGDFMALFLGLREVKNVKDYKKTWWLKEDKSE